MRGLSKDNSCITGRRQDRKGWSPFAEHLKGGKKVLEEDGGYVVEGCQPRSLLQSPRADEQVRIIFMLLVFSYFPHQAGGSQKSRLQQ